MEYILTGSSIIICPHGGVIQHGPLYSNDIMIYGKFVCFQDDDYFINGCVSGCKRVEWFSWCQTLVYKGKKYVLTNNSKPMCRKQDGAYNGQGRILFYQTEYDVDKFVKDWAEMHKKKKKN